MICPVTDYDILSSVTALHQTVKELNATIIYTLLDSNIFGQLAICDS